MNGWGPSDDSFATREATIKDGIAWARYQLGLTNGDSNDFCDDCDEEIPEARKKAIKGCKFCVQCQTKHDNIQSSYYNRRGSKDSQLR